MIRARTVSPAAALIVLLTACNDSPTASTGDRMTRQEAQAIANGISQSGSNATTGLRPASGGSDVTASAPPSTFTVNHESSHPCPQGGRITVGLDVTFMVDVADRTYSLDTEGALTHAGCMFVQDGVTLTVTGDPRLTYEGHAAVEDGRPKGPWRSEAGGAINWSASDGRSGRCVVDLSDVTDFVAKTRTVQGEVCGHTVTHTVSWT